MCEPSLNTCQYLVRAHTHPIVNLCVSHKLLASQTKRAKQGVTAVELWHHWRLPRASGYDKKSCEKSSDVWWAAQYRWAQSTQLLMTWSHSYTLSGSWTVHTVRVTSCQFKPFQSESASLVCCQRKFVSWVLEVELIWWKAVRNQILVLNGNTIIYPWHNSQSTVW